MPVKSITATPSLTDIGADFVILFPIFTAEILLFFSLENIAVIPINMDININAENIINFLSFLTFFSSFADRKFEISCSTLFSSSRFSFSSSNDI